VSITSATTASVRAGRALPADPGRTVDRAVFDLAAARPQSPALRDPDGSWTTYGQLAGIATAAAGGLWAAGVRPGDVVAVRMPLSARTVGVLIGVMRCGAATLGIPTDWPAARVSEVLDVAGARLVVSAGDLELAVDTRSPDDLLARPFGAGLEELSAPDPAAAAAVFVTSGSTGRPKPVLVSHRGLLRTGADPALQLSESSVGLAKYPPAWDGFALDLWPLLLTGGTCHLRTDARLTAADLRAEIGAGVNHVFLTAASFNALVDDDPACLAGLRMLLVGGERMSPRHAAAYRHTFPAGPLVNLYGPVEASVYVSTYAVPPGAAATDGVEDIPIGGDIAPGTDIYVLDDEGQPVGTGCLGEIAIGGEATAIGYLGQAEETARQFPELPLGPAGEPVRVYRTGDLGRLHVDGTLHFAGRRDRLIKLRGVRIEPGEIEACAEAVPGVETMVVVPLPDRGTAVTALAGCYTGSAAPAEAELRERLAARLPAAYVPQILLRLDALPLNGHQKLDVAALAELARAHRARQYGGAAADEDGDEGGDLLAAVQAELTALLGFAPTADADLMGAGLDSLSAVRLANRLSRLQGHPVTVTDVLLAGNPAELARRLESADPRTEPATGPLPGGPVRTQREFRVLEQVSPGTPDLLIPVIFIGSGRLDPQLARAALEVLVRRNEPLRTRLVLARDWSQVRAEVVPVDELPPLLTVDEPMNDRADARARALGFVRRPFRLNDEIPFRALLIPLPDDEFVLALGLHHTAFDGFSHDILAAELSAALRDLLAGRRPDETPVRFTEVFARQEATVTDEAKAAARAFFRPRLTGLAAPVLGPPVSPGRAGPAREIPIPLDGEVLERAARVAAAARTSVTAVLLATWVRAVSSVTGRDRLAVSLPVAGRTLPEAASVIGCFAHNVVVAFDDPGVEPAGLIAAAAEQLVAAVRWQDVDGDTLLPGTGSDARDWNTYYSVNFTVQQHRARLDVPGLEAEAIRVGRPATALKLTLEVWLTDNPEAVLRYRRECLDPADAAALARRWRAELDQLTETRNAD
jgi:amino acid adenylation domain-containing protein